MTERGDGLWEPEWDKSEGWAAIMNRNEWLLSNFVSAVRSEILLMNFILSEQYVLKHELGEGKSSEKTIIRKRIKNAVLPLHEMFFLWIPTRNWYKGKKVQEKKLTMAVFTLETLKS